VFLLFVHFAQSDSSIRSLDKKLAVPALLENTAPFKDSQWPVVTAQ
jgi:hypothetical protein